MNTVMLIFFIALAASAIVYYIVPLKFRWIVLLVESVAFYVAIDTYLIAFICSTILTVYFGARYIQRNNDRASADDNADKVKIKKKNKAMIALIIIFNLGIIGFLKYFNFLGGTINSLLALFGAQARIPFLKLFLPLGISFYTLQAIGYLIDVYRRKYPAERHFGKLSLFLLFFPQILEGPIARYDQTGAQIFEGHRADYKNITFGLQRILWGLFKKMVVADRLYLLVKTVSDAPANFSGIASLLFILFYTIQLYADFSGFIDIAIGSGEIFGISLPENFKQPFFAASAQDFWKRWHITLGAWLKEYVFYSVALSPRVVKASGKLKKKWKSHFTKMLPTGIALLAVWFCNGLWHGPEWKYIVYGMYYFIIIFTGMMLEPLFKKFWQKLHVSPENKGLAVFRHIRTLLIIFVGETIFGANSLSDAFVILASVFKPYHGSMFSLGLDYKEFIIAILGIATIFVVDGIKERGVSIRSSIAAKAFPIRWAAYLSVIVVIIIFGAYGGLYSVMPFIYGNF